MGTRNYKNGFTLVELMIVLVIVAVLLLVAYPSYSKFLIKGNRAAAQAHLMRIAQRNTQYFNDARAYTNDPNDLGLASAPDRVEDFYDLALELDPNAPPPGFYATATPKAGTRQAGDGQLFINNSGRKIRSDPKQGDQPW